jgi:hypothetical protein
VAYRKEAVLPETRKRTSLLEYAQDALASGLVLSIRDAFCYARWCVNEEVVNNMVSKSGSIKHLSTYDKLRMQLLEAQKKLGETKNDMSKVLDENRKLKEKISDLEATLASGYQSPKIV